MPENTILEFKGEYKFLSNFYYSPFIFNNIRFPTNEHFFQVNKTINKDEFQYILDSDTPAIAKRRGKEINIAPNWDNIKNRVMYVGVYNKFVQNSRLKYMLICTQESELIEGNYWNDKYWGICLKTNEGENHLGKILMSIRKFLYYESFVISRLNTIWRT
jgi:ribA/ribD-fused uncharacterized protein